MLEIFSKTFDAVLAEAGSPASRVIVHGGIVPLQILHALVHLVLDVVQIALASGWIVDAVPQGMARPGPHPGRLDSFAVQIQNAVVLVPVIAPAGDAGEVRIGTGTRSCATQGLDLGDEFRRQPVGPLEPRDVKSANGLQGIMGVRRVDRARPQTTHAYFAGPQHAGVRTTRLDAVRKVQAVRDSLPTGHLLLGSDLARRIHRQGSDQAQKQQSDGVADGKSNREMIAETNGA